MNVHFYRDLPLRLATGGISLILRRNFWFLLPDVISSLIVNSFRNRSPDRSIPHLLQSLGGKVGEDESSLVDARVVVLALLDLLLGSPLAQGLGDIAASLLAADHEANLARRVGRDGGEAVLGNGEDGGTVLLDLLDQRQVEPLALGYSGISSQHNKPRKLALSLSSKFTYPEW